MSFRYSMFSADFNTTLGTANDTLTLTQIRSQRSQANAQRAAVRPGGSLDVLQQVLSTANPTATFVTRDLAGLFSPTPSTVAVSLTTGLYCDLGHIARFQKRVEGGGFETGADHMVQTSPRGFLNITSIEADVDAQDGAEANIEYTPMSTTGVDPPFVQTDGIDFTAVPNPAFSSIFYLGPCFLGSTQLVGLIRSRVLPGIVFRTRRADGGPFTLAACSSIQMRQPSFEMTFLKVNMIVTNILAFFSSNLGEQLDVFFTKGVVGNAGRVPNATAEHLRVSALTGDWGADDLSVADEDDATVTVRVNPTGTIAFSITSVIP